VTVISGSGDAPLDYRLFLVDLPRMTSATAVSTATRTFSTHFLWMSGTKPLRSGGPAEGGGGGVAVGDLAPAEQNWETKEYPLYV